MRILMINKFLFPKGGAETYILKLGNYMESQGHEVQYFGMEHESRCVGNAAGVYTEKMDLHGAPKLSKLTYSYKTIYSSGARRKLHLVLNGFKPDVCHLNNFNYQLTPSIILEIEKWRKQTKKKCRIVYTAHDYQLICPNHLLRNPNTGESCEKCLGGHFFNCVKGKCIHGSRAKSVVGAAEAMFWKRNKVYKYIDAVVCCSAFLKIKMDSNPLFAKKTVVLHNFIDGVEWKNIKKKEYVLYFGRFDKEKGIETLAEACRGLPEIPFIFAGNGPLKKELENVPNVKNVGFQRGEALKTLIREARFSVCPSECYENCPFSVLESQAYGTPVLGARIGGIPELIKEGETGELFERGNVAELKDKIWNMWMDRELTDQYSRNCRNINFDDIGEYTEKLMRIYRGKEKGYVVEDMDSVQRKVGKWL